jgi:uncharacterized protein
MKNAVILHGTGETPNSYWYPYIEKELEKNDYAVSIPQLPDTDHPTYDNWLPAALKESYNEETIIIGHSAGGPLVLSVLEKLPTKVKQAILVAGYVRIKGKETKPDAILQQNYDWKKIRNNVDDILFLNSDNDPWGCNDVEGRYMLDQINKGKLIIMKGEGHMGSGRFQQPYNEFPFLLKLINL